MSTWKDLPLWPEGLSLYAEVETSKSRFVNLGTDDVGQYPKLLITWEVFVGFPSFIWSNSDGTPTTWDKKGREVDEKRNVMRGFSIRRKITSILNFNCMKYCIILFLLCCAQSCESIYTKEVISKSSYTQRIPIYTQSRTITSKVDVPNATIIFINNNKFNVLVGNDFHFLEMKSKSGVPIAGMATGIVSLYEDYRLLRPGDEHKIKLGKVFQSFSGAITGHLYYIDNLESMPKIYEFSFVP